MALLYRAGESNLLVLFGPLAALVTQRHTKHTQVTHLSITLSGCTQTFLLMASAPCAFLSRGGGGGGGGIKSDCGKSLLCVCAR